MRHQETKLKRTTPKIPKKDKKAPGEILLDCRKISQTQFFAALVDSSTQRNATQG